LPLSARTAACSGRVGNYNAVRQERDVWKKQVRELQSTVKDTNQRLDAVQSLATDVAMTFGVMKYHPAAFEQTDAPSTPEDVFDRSVEQFTFLKRNAIAIAVSSGGLRMMPSMAFADSNYTPSAWPVMGHITDGFGERLDPFSGEGAFHTGVDVGADYVLLCTPQQMAWCSMSGSIPVMAGSSSWITGSASPPGTRIFRLTPSVAGTRIKRGEVIGYTGISGRSTGPHVHYEVRVNNAPVNPWRYMRNSTPSAD